MPIPVPEPSPPTRPAVVSSLTDMAWGYLPAYVRAADTDQTLYRFLASVCMQADPVLALLDASDAWGDPWGVPSNRLGWLAALAGLDMTGVDREQWRAWIDSPTSRYRGSRAAIVARVGHTLTGAKRVIVECPYDGSPWKIRVRTFSAETPDATATEDAIRAEVPSWLALTVDVASGMTWDERKTKYGTWDDEKATLKTYDELSVEAP